MGRGGGDRFLGGRGSLKRTKSNQEQPTNIVVDQYSWPQNAHGSVFPQSGEHRLVRIRVPFFSVVYFRKGTLPPKRVKGHLAGGPARRWTIHPFASTLVLAALPLGKALCGSIGEGIEKVPRSGDGVHLALHAVHAKPEAHRFR